MFNVVNSTIDTYSEMKFRVKEWKKRRFPK